MFAIYLIGCLVVMLGLSCLRDTWLVARWLCLGYRVYKILGWWLVGYACVIMFARYFIGG